MLICMCKVIVVHGVDMHLHGVDMLQPISAREEVKQQLWPLNHLQHACAAEMALCKTPLCFDKLTLGTH